MQNWFPPAKRNHFHYLWQKGHTAAWSCISMPLQVSRLSVHKSTLASSTPGCSLCPHFSHYSFSLASSFFVLLSLLLSLAPLFSPALLALATSSLLAMLCLLLSLSHIYNISFNHIMGRSCWQLLYCAPSNITLCTGEEPKGGERERARERDSG